MESPTQFTLTISTFNAAFDDDPEAEIARILHAVANRLEAIYDAETGYTEPVRDANGNVVGRFEFSEA